jgi:hypothetical protein
MSEYYNQDITNREKKKRHDLIAAPTRLGSTSWVCYHGRQEGHFCTECLRGDSLGDSATLKQDPALSAKVTTGTLSAPSPDRRWGATSYELMGPSLLFMLHFLASMLRSLMVVIIIKKERYFPTKQWSSFLSQYPVQWQGYHSGQIWPAPRVLVYLACGLLLGRPPLLSLFPHST